MRRSDIEIMAPVGSYESLVAAIQAGADSVYFGVGKLNMRSASAANFTLDDLAKIVATARAAGVKTYLTVNTIVYEDELRTVHEVIDRAKAEGIDASEVMGAVYVAVATEINLIRAIESTDDMVGFTATGRSAWTADCGNYANLFDGSTSTS
ncbi:peptidase U32 family protein, partial [Akkermansia sp. BIOML-A52]|uniref:peptidase U32 family protein n=1 Tax=Akkermansia sp. BIOML-A52 TaxID=2584608 RepID=UPI0034E0B44B